MCLLEALSTTVRLRVIKMAILCKNIKSRLRSSGGQFLDRSSGKTAKNKGFSLLEVVLGIALVGIAMLGLAQLFTFSIMNNARSDRVTNAIFLAQQQIDFLRNHTVADLQLLALNPIDEQIDVNSDGIIDFRRVTEIQQSGFYWNVRIRVYPGAQAEVSTNDIIQNSSQYKIRADISTVISR